MRINGKKFIPFVLMIAMIAEPLATGSMMFHPKSASAAGDNLLVNGSHEAGIGAHWNLYSAQSPDTYTVTVDEDQHKSGTKSVKISVQSGTSVTMYQAANITGGKSYKYST